MPGDGAILTAVFGGRSIVLKVVGSAGSATVSLEPGSVTIGRFAPLRGCRQRHDISRKVPARVVMSGQVAPRVATHPALPDLSRSEITRAGFKQRHIVLNA